MATDLPKSAYYCATVPRHTEADLKFLLNLYGPISAKNQKSLSGGYVLRIIINIEIQQDKSETLYVHSYWTSQLTYSTFLNAHLALKGRSTIEPVVDGKTKCTRGKPCTWKNIINDVYSNSEVYEIHLERNARIDDRGFVIRTITICDRINEFDRVPISNFYRSFYDQFSEYRITRKIFMHNMQANNNNPPIMLLLDKPIPTESQTKQSFTDKIPPTTTKSKTKVYDSSTHSFLSVMNNTRITPSPTLFTPYIDQINKIVVKERLQKEFGVEYVERTNLLDAAMVGPSVLAEWKNWSLTHGFIASIALLYGSGAIKRVHFHGPIQPIEILIKIYDIYSLSGISITYESI